MCTPVLSKYSPLLCRPSKPDRDVASEKGESFEQAARVAQQKRKSLSKEVSGQPSSEKGVQKAGSGLSAFKVWSPFSLNLQHRQSANLLNMMPLTGWRVPSLKVAGLSSLSVNLVGGISTLISYEPELHAPRLQPRSTW